MVPKSIHHDYNVWRWTDNGGDLRVYRRDNNISNISVLKNKKMLIRKKSLKDKLNNKEAIETPKEVKVEKKKANK